MLWDLPFWYKISSEAWSRCILFAQCRPSQSEGYLQVSVTVNSNVYSSYSNNNYCHLCVYLVNLYYKSFVKTWLVWYYSWLYFKWRSLDCCSDPWAIKYHFDIWTLISDLRKTIVCFKKRKPTRNHLFTSCFEP